MKYKPRYTTRAWEDLAALDHRIAQRIVKKIRIYAETPDPFAFAEALGGQWKGCFRFRIGDYRAVFRKAPSGQLILLLILHIERRDKIYRR